MAFQTLRGSQSGGRVQHRNRPLEAVMEGFTTCCGSLEGGRKEPPWEGEAGSGSGSRSVGRGLVQKGSVSRIWRDQRNLPNKK